MIKKHTFVALFVMLIFILTGCDQTDGLIEGTSQQTKNWELIEDSANKTLVTVSVTSENEAFVNWLKDDFSSYMALNHNITLNIVVQPIAKTYEKLMEDKTNEVEYGQFDVIFLDGDQFSRGYRNNLLFGPFTGDLPNYSANLNPNDLEVIYDEGLEIKGYEVPYGRSQLVLTYDEDYFYEPPETNEEFLGIIKEFSGFFTYPDPRTSKAGEAFVLSMVLQDADFEKLSSGKLNDEALFQLIKPGLDNLVALKPDLYQSGAVYPKSVDELDQLYENGEIIISMSLEYNHTTDKLKAYEYPEYSNSFILPTGTAGYTDYVGIAYNSPNKSGAMVVVNELIGPANQGDMYHVKNGGKLPVYDVDYTPNEAFSDIKSVKLKSTTLKYSELLNNRFPEINLETRNKIIDYWETYVLNAQME